MKDQLLHYIKSHTFTFVWSTALGAALVTWTVTGGAEPTLKITLGVLLLNVVIWSAYGKWAEIQARNKPAATVIWLTGLSGAGKTTIAEKLCEILRKRQVTCENLDGDVIRRYFPKTGFSREERDTHIRRVGYVASCLEKYGVTVVAALISPYEESREFVRSICQNYMEVYISTHINLCEKRDVKGLYAKARQGILTQFTGIDDAYDVPKNPDVVIDTEHLTVEEAADQVIQAIARRRKGKSS